MHEVELLINCRLAARDTLTSTWFAAGGWGNKTADDEWLRLE